MPDECSDQTASDFDFDEWAQTYHLHPRPEVTPRYLASIRSTGLLEDPQYHWQLLGFFSELFARHSDRVADWLQDWQRYSAGDQKFVFEAVWLSDSKEAQAFLQTVGPQRLKEMFEQDLAAIPPPGRDGIPIEHPGVLDYFWSRFFVTGSAEHVRTIIGCLPLLYGSPELPDGQVDAGPMLIGGTAQWSLVTNARQHQTVLDICQAERPARSGATRQLLEVIVRNVEDAASNAQESEKQATHESAETAPAEDVLRELSLERQFFNGVIGGHPTSLRNDREARLIRKRWDGAAVLAEELVQTGPTAPGPRILLADLLRMGHNIDVPGAAESCRQILTEVLQANPHDAEAHYTLACLYVSIHPEAAPLAEKHFLEAERFAGQHVNPDTYQGLGFACVSQKKVDEAISHFEKYLQLGGRPEIREIVNHLSAGHECQHLFKPITEPSPRRRWWQFWR